MIEKYFDNLKLMTTLEHVPFEKPLHELFDKEKCLAPIGSLSYHINRHVPATTENWTDLWQKNFQKL